MLSRRKTGCPTGKLAMEDDVADLMCEREATGRLAQVRTDVNHVEHGRLFGPELLQFGAAEPVLAAPAGGRAKFRTNRHRDAESARKRGNPDTPALA